MKEIIIDILRKHGLTISSLEQTTSLRTCAEELSTLIKEFKKEAQREAVEGYAQDCEDRNSHVFHGLSKGIYLKTAAQYLQFLEDRKESN